MVFHGIAVAFGIFLLISVDGMFFCFLLGALGFEPAGVVAGSCAAAWQSVIGNVAKGTLFALLQSISATCALGLYGFITLLLIIAAVSGFIYYQYHDTDGPSTSNANVTATTTPMSILTSTLIANLTQSR